MSYPFFVLCITLTNDVEHLFRCFFATYIFSMVKCLFKILPIFKLNHFLLSFEFLKHILQTGALDRYDLQIFFPSL